MNTKTVFILGAGASKESGAPTMPEFLDVADSLWKRGLVNAYMGDFENTFKAIAKLQSIYPKAILPLDNIETIFASFEVANIINKMPETDSKDIPGLIRSLKRLIVATLITTQKFYNDNGNIQAHDSITKFVEAILHLQRKSSPQHDVSVITFNYDIALDIELARLGMRYNYCLDSNDDERIKLLKLHGSLNWAKCTNKDCGKITIIEFKETGRDTIILDNNLGEYHLNLPPTWTCNNCKKQYNYEPVLVPPTWDKSSYQKTLTSVWSRAAEVLGSAENIIVIGYSLPQSDDFFRYLFALGAVGKKPLKNFLLFDPKIKDGVEERYQALLGPGASKRFKPYDDKFTGATHIIRSYFGVA